LPSHNKDAVVIATSTGAVSVPEEMVITSSSYVSSKLALMKFIEVLAAENKDIRFHTIHPGVVDTDMAATSDMKGLPMDTGKLSSLRLSHDQISG
jgi:NAD(P)-dependent dehydrogenase (short-subunit alcohol dehydrogenase family)